MRVNTFSHTHQKCVLVRSHGTSTDRDCFQYACHASCNVVKDSFTCLARIERLGLAGRYHRGNEGEFSTTNGTTVWFLLLKSGNLCFKASYPVSVGPVEPF
jgi:hypothetical protein